MFLRKGFIAAVAALACLNFLPLKATAQSQPEVRMSRDQVNTIFGLPWAASRWPFSQWIVLQRNEIDPTVDGWAVFDRHGVDQSSDYISNPFSFIEAPFAGPLPGRVVIISGWGSFNDFCFAELLLQVAIGPSQGDASVLVPSRIEMNVGGELVELQAVSDASRYSNARPFQFKDYVYNDRTNEYDEVVRNGVWYTGRHIFLISADAAAKLRSAPDGNVPIRVTLSNNFPFTYEIGRETVRRWQRVFQYNPSCNQG